MDETKINQIIDKYQGKPSSLIQALLEVQRESHWLPREVLSKVSEKLGVPLSRVLHVATFYKAFNVVPEGHHEIHVCNGTSCHVRGAPCVLDAVQNLTGTTAGVMDPELKYSLKAVTCVGCCSAGPVMVVDGKYHGAMNPTKAEDTLKNSD